MMLQLTFNPGLTLTGLRTTQPRLLQLALDDLKSILLLNGYPMGTVKYHMNDVIVKQTVKRKDVLIVLPFLGYHSQHLTKQLRSCINKFYGISTSKQLFRSPEESSPFSLSKISQLLLSGQKQCTEQTVGIAVISTQGK